MRLFKTDNQRFTNDFNDMLKIAILNSLGFFFVGFLVPIIARNNMNASGIEISIIISVQVLGRALSGAITGYLVDKLKSKTVFVLIGSIGRAISYLVLYLAIITNSIVMLGTGMFVLGTMAGIFWVPFNTLIAEKSSKDNRSQAYGKRNSANAIGQIIGGVIGFTLMTVLSFYTENPALLYLSIPFYGAANLYAGYKFHREVNECIKFYDSDIELKDKKKSEEDQIKYNYSTIIIIGTILLMILLFLASINGSIAKPFLNIYVLENIDDNLFLATWAYLPAGLVATLLAPKIGSLADKIRPIISIPVISALGALMTWLLINSPNIWIFALFLMFDIAIAMGAGLILQNILSRISKLHRGKILGMGDFFMFMGNVIGPILGGIVWDFVGPKAPFVISIIVELSLIPLFLVVVYYLLPHLSEKYKDSDQN